MFDIFFTASDIKSRQLSKCHDGPLFLSDKTSISTLVSCSNITCWRIRSRPSFMPDLIPSDSAWLLVAVLYKYSYELTIVFPCVPSYSCFPQVTFSCPTNGNFDLASIWWMPVLLGMVSLPSWWCFTGTLMAGSVFLTPSAF